MCVCVNVCFQQFSFLTHNNNIVIEKILYTHPRKKEIVVENGSYVGKNIQKRILSKYTTKIQLNQI